jgi:hypothetical protein
VRVYVLVLEGPGSCESGLWLCFERCFTLLVAISGDRGGGGEGGGEGAE